MENPQNDQQQNNANLELLKKAESENKSNPKSHEQELENLKNEVIKNINEKKGKKKVQWGSAIVTFILLILTSVAVFQAFESANILNKLNSNTIKAAGNANTSGTDKLPDMVGGC